MALTRNAAEHFRNVYQEFVKVQHILNNLSTFSGIKSEIDRLIKSKIERILSSKGFVSREDFHALEDRVEKLETEIIFKKIKKQTKKSH